MAESKRAGLLRIDRVGVYVFHALDVLAVLPATGRKAQAAHGQQQTCNDVLFHDDAP